METVLSVAEIRVLGCLIEKETATPEYYPLTMNALVAACNQKSNRDPVMLLDENTVLRSLDDLRINHQLVQQVSTSGSRVAKYRHCLTKKWDMSTAEVDVLCELFVRGPQTVGELRGHTSRLHECTDLAAVESTLQRLAEREDGPFVVKLPREPGRREQRWAHLVGGDIDVEALEQAPAPEPARLQVQAENERIAALEGEVAALREAVETLKQDLEEFKRQFN
jgi:uncharacterized protein YceH (UPF0502 family)